MDSKLTETSRFSVYYADYEVSAMSCNNVLK